MRPGFRFTIEIDKGIVTTPGIDFGGRVQLIHQEGQHAVLRVPGGTHWSGIGSRSSHPSQWMLVKIMKETTSASRSVTGRAFTRDVATVIVEESPGTKWRATRERMIKLCQRAIWIEDF